MGNTLTRTLVAAIVLLSAARCGGVATRPSEIPYRGAEPPPPADIVTDYQLTFTASPSCSFPAPLMKRTYGANIRTWEGFPNVAVDISGGTFFREWAVGFEGTRDGDRFWFTIVGIPPDDFSHYFYDYGLAELIGGTELLTYDGTAVATARGSSITGTFNGRISRLDNATHAVLAECSGTDHKIEFVR